MKQIVSSIVAASMIFTSCSGVQTRARSQAPAPTKKADAVAVQSVQSKIDAGQADVAASAGVSNSSKLGGATTAMLNATVDRLMKAGELFIRDFSGAPVTSEEYKLNPSQYYLLYKQTKTDKTFKALNTSFTKQENSDLFSLHYKIYSNIASPEAFKGSELGEPSVSDSVQLSTNPLAMLQNKDAINALMQRLGDAVQIAESKNSVSNFLMPTAFAQSTYLNALMITAIVFTSVAVISYLFAWYGFGTFSAAIGLTFWLLYWFSAAYPPWP